MTNYEKEIKILEEQRLQAILSYRECIANDMPEVAQDYQNDVKQLAKRINEIKNNIV